MKMIKFGETKPKGLKLYHGSNVKVVSPEIRIHRYTKDFGPGFYLTNNYLQAVRYVKKFGKERRVNVYELDLSIYSELEIKIFDNVSEEWLDFIMDCRNGEKHEYDLVEGPMADDHIWKYTSQFFNGEISREEFWRKAKFPYYTHQICLNTDESLKYLTFKTCDII